ncbi:DUF4279 domain-containing protein [Exilibacterium tricleocarpae]|uniref:DUF4279 domain-containing protein n=1 Tax=Exilibacterium tricleocarpae TaxID=2591008 RepID=A0A545TM20_9GAMM|nr:DUF4279 domain-containing protein [Exilibacterium tricleocarpae]TQV78280.1 DUF4279 domain-containing protein [Exilibacterium tricleocarpae]
MALEVKTTLRVYSETLLIDDFKEILGEPSRGFSRGDPWSKGKRFRKHSYWSLSSSIERTCSFDNHLSEILDFAESKKEEIIDLRSKGCDIDISVFFDSDNGQGGAILSSSTMKRLSDLELSLVFDVYADG